MKQPSIPTCYFPSTVVFIDDSRDFLINFTLQLPDDLSYRIFDSPYDALDLIFAQQRGGDNLNQRCVSEYLDSNHWPLTNQTVNLDLSAIHSEVYNPQRFNEVSVVVVDYAMPGMNGLEFCRKLENSAIKKILLTGQADEKTAIEAFNDGLIDRFVQKSDPNVVELINDGIRSLQQEYFQNMSGMIVKMLAVNSPSCLMSHSFAELFKALCKEHHIVEYYLTDSSGSFLMLDTNGQPHCLIVKNEQDLRLLYDLAKDNHASDDILMQLKEGRRIPYFWQSSSAHSEWSDWSTCLIPAKQLQTDHTYYYAFVNNPMSPDIRKEKIFSYEDHIEHLDQQV